MLVLSIDVGVVNLGVCLFDIKMKTIVRADATRLADSMREISGELDYVMRLTAMCADRATVLGSMMAQADVVIIERQMRRNMMIVQHVLATIGQMNGKRVEYVSPQSVKVWFRKQIGLIVPPRSSAISYHYANKVEAKEVFTYMFPTFTLPPGKGDDVADASLQAAYWSAREEKKNKTRGPKKKKANP
jgi:hypothetical protein